MKNAFKFFALALVVLPCCLVFAGCGSGKEILTNEDMYNTYKSALKSTMSNESSYTLTRTSKTITTIVRSDNKALTEEEKAEFTQYDDDEMERQTINSFNKSAGEGYEYYYTKDANGVVGEGGLTYIVKEEDKWVYYTVSNSKNGEEVVEAEYVGSDHAAHEYEFSRYLVEEVYKEEVVDAYPTWQSFIQHMDDREGATMKISGEKGNYTLVKENGSQERLETYFDKNHITGTKFEIGDTYSQPVDGEEGVTYSITSTLVIEKTIKYSFDSSRMRTDLKDKVKGTIYNAIAFVTFNLDGAHQRKYQDGEFGDAIIIPDGIVKEHTTVKWYLDEEMTKEFVINDQTKVPSYDIELYGKSQADEGYAIVIYVCDVVEGPKITQFYLDTEVVELASLTDNKIELKSFENYLGMPYEYKSTDGATYDAQTNEITLTNKAYVVVHLIDVNLV